MDLDYEAGTTLSANHVRSFDLPLLNMLAPIITWFYKKQTTLETSVFGGECVALKFEEGMETLQGIRYKLQRMMGVFLLGGSIIHLWQEHVRDPKYTSDLNWCLVRRSPIQCATCLPSMRP